MASALGHLRDLVSYARTRSDHDKADRVANTHLAVPADELGLPPSVEIRWLGVAGFALTCQGTTILIDPYVTRMSLPDMVRRRTVPSDQTIIDAWVPRCDAILLGHTHFDHALDAPAIARRDGATVYGGASARQLMGIHRLPQRAVQVEAHKPYEIGPFKVTFVPSVHSKLFLGRSVPQGGEITCEHVGDLCAQAFGCGQVWGIEIEVEGSTLYHQGSADLIDDELDPRQVDVFLCGVAGRQFTPDYLDRVIPRLDPRVVVATHHDDFFNPLGSDLGFAFGVDLERFPGQVEEVSRSPRVVTLPEPTPVTP